MKTFYLSLSGAAVAMMLLSAGTTMAASPRHPNTGIAHPTYGSQQAKRQARPVYNEPVQSRRSFSYQPRVDVGFKAGGHVKIVGDGVKLMRGHDTLATLNNGQEVSILKVQGNWLGTSIEIGGETKAGWVAARNVVGITDSHEPPPKPARVGNEPQTQATTPCHQTTYRSTNRYTGSVNSYWKDPYGLRAYDPTIPLVRAGEWDPNIHVWDPWASR